MGERNDRALAAFESLFGPEFGHGKAHNLDQLQTALDKLGDPHAHLGAPVLHVAGTNGKGSTIAFIRAIAEAAGLAVHAFTKPHLLALRERFVVAGVQASDDALIAAAERVASISTEITHFDAQVAVALLLFREAPADIILFEAGMGGRDDSTNVIASPAASIITPIGSDHQDALGSTLAGIAAHKAGILKPRSPAVVARQAPEALAVIEERAARVGAPLFRCGIEWDAHSSNGRMVVQTETRALDLPLPTLAGAYQIDNAGLACATLLRWRDLTDSAFAAGVQWTRWPGRLQPLTQGPLSAIVRRGGGELWVDCGHNGHAAEALVQALEAMNRRRPAATVAIVGMRARKDAPAFVAPLARIATLVIGVPLSEDHTLAERIASFAGEFGAHNAIADTLSDAVTRAALTPGSRVLICGSFLLAAEALALEGA